APPGSSPRVSGRPVPAPAPAVGIDHAIQLIRSLPMRENAPLVVRALTTTLESLNIHVADIVQDAARRQQDIESRISALKGEIGALNKEIESRSNEILRLEAAHAETTKVKDYLQLSTEDAPIEEITGQLDNGG